MRAAALASFAVAMATSVSVTVAQDETQVPATKAMCHPPEFHVDYPGNTLLNFTVPTYDECCSACGQIPYCGAYTWTDYEGGMCYIKFVHERTEWKGARPDGSANYISAEVYKCSALAKDVDFVGTDLVAFGASSFPAARAENCCSMCQYYPLCAGFSWSDYNGGTCWMKGEGIKAVSSPGVYSAYKSPRT